MRRKPSPAKPARPERPPRRSSGDGTSSFDAPRRATPAQQRIENACQPASELQWACELTASEGICFKRKDIAVLFGGHGFPRTVTTILNRVSFRERLVDSPLV